MIQSAQLIHWHIHKWIKTYFITVLSDRAVKTTTIDDQRIRLRIYRLINLTRLNPTDNSKLDSEIEKNFKMRIRKICEYCCKIRRVNCCTLGEMNRIRQSHEKNRIENFRKAKIAIGFQTNQSKAKTREQMKKHLACLKKILFDGLCGSCCKIKKLDCCETGSHTDTVRIFKILENKRNKNKSIWILLCYYLRCLLR